MGDVSARVVKIGGSAIYSCAGAIEVLWIAERLGRDIPNPVRGTRRASSIG